MTLPKYEEIQHNRRSHPCQEYPGEWLVCIPESMGPYWSRFWFSKERPHLGHSFQTFDEAMRMGRSFMTFLENERFVYRSTDTISVCWKASDDDPRIGQIWFTPFYMHGKFKWTGEYVET